MRLSDMCWPLRLERRAQPSPIMRYAAAALGALVVERAGVLMALLFGVGASAFVDQLYAQGFGVRIPAGFLSVLPYGATIGVLAIIGRDSKAILLNRPASLGRNFHASD